MNRGWIYILNFIQFSDIQLFKTIIKYEIFQYFLMRQLLQKSETSGNKTTVLSLQYDKY